MLGDGIFWQMEMVVVLLGIVILCCSKTNNLLFRLFISQFESQIVPAASEDHPVQVIPSDFQY